MKITPDIVRREFVGSEGKIVKSSHTGYVGIRGKIVEETKNTFSILHRSKTKRIIKNTAVFNFKFSDGSIVEIDGKLLVGRPENRIKRIVKRLW